MTLENTLSHINGAHDRIVELQRNLVCRRAVGPENGGEGELEKTKYLEGFLKQIGCPLPERIDAPDNRAPSGVRPNLLVTIPGPIEVLSNMLSETIDGVLFQEFAVGEGPNPIWVGSSYCH